MYAIIESGGKQYQVAQGDKVRVDYLGTPIGNLIEINEIKMIKDQENILTGDSLKEAKVKVLVLGHPKGRKIVAFKYKKRKNYRKKIGHRQLYTQLLVKEIKY